MFYQAVEGFTAMAFLVNSFNVMKNSVAISVLAASVQVASAEGLTLDLQPDTAKKAEPRREFVEAYDVLLLDASGSMDDGEIIAMFDGVRDHYMSDEAVVNYEMGLCTAVTVVYYGDRASAKPAYILCNAEDVQKFVFDNVDIARISEVRSEVGTSATYLNYALKEAIITFDDSMIEAPRRRVVVVGDEKGGVPQVLGKTAGLLSSTYGATISAVAIGNGGESVQDAFSRSIVTPPGTKYFEPQYDGSVRERKIAAGMAFVAVKREEVSGQLQMALSLGGY